ncbi:MAG: hypothetical protein ABI670_00655 [Chloroflexota bacterium]
MPRNEETRPKVLDNASETQIEELQRQSEQGDKQGWKALTTSYGWSDEISQEVWDWFAVDPDEGLS